jgi:hypothetical protein
LDAMKKMGKITQIEYNLGDAYEGLYHAYQLNDHLIVLINISHLPR